MVLWKTFLSKATYRTISMAIAGKKMHNPDLASSML